MGEEHRCCPECLKKGKHNPVETYSRIVGYLRPTSLWNPGKAQEYRERTEYEVKK